MAGNTNEILTHISNQIHTLIAWAQVDLEFNRRHKYRAEAHNTEFRLRKLKKALKHIENSFK